MGPPATATDIATATGTFNTTPTPHHTHHTPHTLSHVHAPHVLMKKSSTSTVELAKEGVAEALARHKANRAERSMVEVARCRRAEGLTEERSELSTNENVRF